MLDNVWKVGCLVILGLLLGATITLSMQNHLLRESRNEFRQQASDLQADNAKLQASLDAAISASKSKDDLVSEFKTYVSDFNLKQSIKADEVKQALAQVQAEVTKNSKLSNKIMAAVPESKDACEAANLLVNQYLLEVQGEKK